MHFAGIKCDVCPNIKGSVNHWWIIFHYRMLYGYKIVPWNDSDAKLIGDKSNEVFHLCGIECKNKKINELDGKIIDAINNAKVLAEPTGTSVKKRPFVQDFTDRI